jgi:hypothetical protein
MNDETLNELVVEHKEILKSLTNMTTDHEKRIRIIERVITVIMGAIAVFEFILKK